MLQENIDLIEHRSHEVPANLEHFWAVTVLSNPQRFKRRYELYHSFAKMCHHAGVKLITVEIAFGHRKFMVTDHNNPHHVQLRSHEELWHKENMMNLGVQRATHLDPFISEIAFIDADLRPMAHPRHWFEETWHELQHYEAVQMYEWFMNLDSQDNPLDGPKMSFMASYHAGGRHIPTNQSGPDSYVKPGQFWLGPPGGAWAWNIEPFKAVGGMIDFCILGSADWHMAQGLLGILEPMKGEDWSSTYSKRLFDWQERALRWVKKDVGFVHGGLMHGNHGSKVLRYYVDRKKIIVEREFSPNTDIKYDHQGLLQLETWSERQIKLRDDVRAYFRARFEDQPEYKVPPGGKLNI